MSSHHIIRDEQEPPVLVFQLNDNWGALSEILGWFPILLIDPALAATFDLKQTKIDGFMWRGSETQFTENDLFYEKNDLGHALMDWMLKKNGDAVNIFCDQKQMMDLFSQFKASSLTFSIIFFTERGKYVLKPYSTYRKWLPKNFRLEVLRSEIKNVKNLASIGKFYQVEEDGFVKIEVLDDLVLIGEN